MTKKDFELIAEVIGQYMVGITGGIQHRTSLAESFAARLVLDNPRFDRKRFIAAVERNTENVRRPV